LPTREEMRLAAIPGRKSCANTSTNAIAPASPAAIRPALTTGTASQAR
jgi:hypothetical protein